jgi:hypothetical protein
MPWVPGRLRQVDEPRHGLCNLRRVTRPIFRQQVRYRAADQSQGCRPEDHAAIGDPQCGSRDQSTRISVERMVASRAIRLHRVPAFK